MYSAAEFNGLLWHEGMWTCDGDWLFKVFTLPDAPDEMMGLFMYTQCITYTHSIIDTLTHHTTHSHTHTIITGRTGTS